MPHVTVIELSEPYQDRSHLYQDAPYDSDIIDCIEERFYQLPIMTKFVQQLGEDGESFKPAFVKGFSLPYWKGLLTTMVDSGELKRALESFGSKQMPIYIFIERDEKQQVEAVTLQCSRYTTTLSLINVQQEVDSILKNGLTYKYHKQAVKAEIGTVWDACFDAKSNLERATAVQAFNKKWQGQMVMSLTTSHKKRSPADKDDMTLETVDTLGDSVREIYHYPVPACRDELPQPLLAIKDAGSAKGDKKQAAENQTLIADCYQAAGGFFTRDNLYRGVTAAAVAAVAAFAYSNQ